MFEDLSLFASEDADGGLVLRADYRTDLVDEPTIRRVVDDFCAIADARRRAAGNATIGPAGAGAEAGDSPAVTGRTTPPPTIRAIRACRSWSSARSNGRPMRTRWSKSTTRVSYRELNIRANRLAHYLRTRGAAPETVVGLCLGRSVDLVVALLGILKSGAAYLPLDSMLPDERLRFMVNESGAVICVTSAALAHRFTDAVVPSGPD